MKPAVQKCLFAGEQALEAFRVERLPSYLKMNFALFYTFALSGSDKNKIKSAHLHAALTAFQAGAYMDRGWFWSESRVN